MSLKTCVLMGAIVAIAHQGQAQVIQRERPSVMNPATGTQFRVAARTAAPVTPTSSDSIDGLTQVAVQATENDSTARLQALTLYLSPTSNRMRFYVNSQLPIHGSDVTPKPAAGTGGTSKPAPSDYLKSQLQDEHGGLLNLSFGHYGKLAGKTLGNLYAGDDNHGLLLDARYGIKLIELPTQTAQNATFLKEINPFWTGAATLALSIPLYKETVAGASRNAAGGLVVAISVANTYAGQADYATIFSTALHRNLNISNVHLALTLAELGDIEITGTLRSNDPLVKQKLMISFNARR